MLVTGQHRGVDLNLRARVRVGDPEAFGELFGLYARRVYNYAFRLTCDWSTAEEVVSLTFLEAWRLREAVNPEGGPLQPWLFGIATNVTRNLTRSSRRHQAAMGRVSLPIASEDFTAELVSRLDDAERVATVRVAMRNLSKREREVIALCVWSGLDYSAAAAALDVPVGTVRSRLSRARKKLKALVGDQDRPVRLAGNSDREAGQKENSAGTRSG
jgi:RNA polymerase sigma-70 factor, ECF subfamily